MPAFWQGNERFQRSPCFFPGDTRCPHSVTIKSQTRCGEHQKRSIMGCEGEHRHIKKWYWLQIIHVPCLISPERNRTEVTRGDARLDWKLAHKSDPLWDPRTRLVSVSTNWTLTHHPHWPFIGLVLHHNTTFNQKQINSPVHFVIVTNARSVLPLSGI